MMARRFLKYSTNTKNTPSGSSTGRTFGGIIFSRASQDENISKINEEKTNKIENLRVIIKNLITKCNNFQIKIMIIFK